MKSVDAVNNRRGLSLLEVMVASTILLVVIWGTTTLFELALHQRRSLAAMGAGAQIEDTLATIVWNDTSGLLYTFATGGNITCGTTWTAPFSLSDAVVVKCLSLNDTNYNAQTGWANEANWDGFSAEVISPSNNDVLPNGESVYPMPAEVTKTPGAAAIYNKCISNYSFTTAIPPASVNTTYGPFYFCLFVNASARDNTSNHNELLSMQPVIAEFSFFVVSAGLAPVGSPAMSPGMISLGQWVAWEGYGTVLPKAPVMPYMFYNIHWNENPGGGISGSAGVTPGTSGFYRSYQGYYSKSGT